MCCQTKTNMQTWLCTAWPCAAKLRQTCRHDYVLPDHVLSNEDKLCRHDYVLPDHVLSNDDKPADMIMDCLTMCCQMMTNLQTWLWTAWPCVARHRQACRHNYIQLIACDAETMPHQAKGTPVLLLPFTSLLLSTSRQHTARALAPKSSKLSLIEHGPYMGGWPLHATLCAHTTIDHSTTQHKLRPFLGVWQATRKDDAAECKSTLDLLPEDLSLSCFGEGKLTQMSKRQGYQFFFVRCRFPGFFSAMSNTATWPRAQKLARPFQALSAKHVGALLYHSTRLAKT